jgi:hypothetical protein
MQRGLLGLGLIIALRAAVKVARNEEAGFHPTGRSITRQCGGFTLAESIMAVAALAIFFAACFSGIMFNRIATMKSKEEAIAMDFLVHYVETIKAMPFADVTTGRPINSLYNGSGGAPNITIPANNTPVAINTTDFETFHPDLLWLNNRNPQLQVTLTSQSVGGVLHDKHLSVRVAWDAPMGRGGRITSQLDLVRTKDL